MKLFFKILMCFAIFTYVMNYAEAKNMDNLTQKQKDIVKIAALTAAGKQDKLEIVINKSLDNGMTLNELKEVLVQMYAYCGFPRSLNAINTAMKVINARKSNGISDAIGEEPKQVPLSDKYAAGKANHETLFGKSDTKAPFEIFAPAADNFLKEHLFCDIFERGVLSFKDREIATVAALTALDGVCPQKNAHLKAAKNMGLTDNQAKEIEKIVSELKHDDLKQPFAKGEPNPYNKFFTGNTYLTRLSANDDVWNSSIANVTFEKGARTNWYMHSGGQILLVTAGEGRYQEYGKKIQVLKPGDVVRIPPEVKHWHGAAPDSEFSHISIETNLPDNNTTWLEPVTDEEYKLSEKIS